ncbi:MAG: response regulator, partial [Oscillospiraceae bacterium]|nr:response regulator [Oscillospiraceae bacterium]
GYEATRLIRALPALQNARLPIIAMTANVFRSDIEACFEAGMDGHLPKPVDIEKLIETLRKYLGKPKAPLPAEKKTPRPAARNWDAASVIHDVSRAIKMLESLDIENGLSDEELRDYVICVHGMKGVFANIGEPELSGAAFKLETFGRNSNTQAISSETPGFIRLLREFISQLEQEEQKESAAPENADLPRFREMLILLKAACKVYDVNRAEDIIARLKEEAWPQQISKLLGDVSGHLLFSNFDEIIEMINEYIYRGI